VNRAPGWVIDLLGLCLHQDMQTVRDSLDCRSVSDIFDRFTAEAAEPEDVVGYSTIEVQAMAEAVDWLSSKHLAHWQAINRQLRPWARMYGMVDDRRLAEEGAQMLAAFVDNYMKGRGF
jgi:hypothetical protein